MSAGQFPLPDARLSPSTTLGESTVMSVTQIAENALTSRLHSAPACEDDREFLRDHLQRQALHGSFTREFSAAYTRHEDGPAVAVLHRFGSSTLPRCEYVALTSDNFRAVLVVDIDREGRPGGWVESMNPTVARRLESLAQAGFSPAWIGMNPASGKAQAIWHIDPVYAAAGATSSNLELYDVTARELDEYLGGDGCFARHFSRSPFYEGTNPAAYRWHCLHHDVHRLRSLLDALRAVSGREETVETFTGGRARIEAAKKAREAAKKGGLTGADEYRLDRDVVDGITVYWSATPGQALRDYSAFRHALTTGYQLQRDGKPLKNETIIDAFVRAYLTAHDVGGGLRPNELPNQRNLTTMARRVRGYVYANKTPDEPTRARQSTSGRKALATMGRRGGQTAAKRWKTDPQGDYARAQRETLEVSNKRRASSGRSTSFRVAAYFADAYAETGNYPTVKAAAGALGLSTRTVQRGLAKAGISLPTGRRKKG